MEIDDITKEVDEIKEAVSRIDRDCMMADVYKDAAANLMISLDKLINSLNWIVSNKDIFESILREQKTTQAYLREQKIAYVAMVSDTEKEIRGLKRWIKTMIWIIAALCVVLAIV